MVPETESSTQLTGKPPHHGIFVLRAAPTPRRTYVYDEEYKLCSLRTVTNTQRSLPDLTVVQQTAMTFASSHHNTSAFHAALTLCSGRSFTITIWHSSTLRAGQCWTVFPSPLILADRCFQEISRQGDREREKNMNKHHTWFDVQLRPLTTQQTVTVRYVASSKRGFTRNLGCHSAADTDYSLLEYTSV
jgi:hypothetical protein